MTGHNTTTTTADASLSPPGLAQRLRTLEACFAEVAATRMHGVPVLHPGLVVQAVGFELQAEALSAVSAGPATPAGPRWACGVLVTPWFMNLLRLPLQPLSADAAAQAGWLAPGATAARTLGAHRLDFIGAWEPAGGAQALGAFEASPLFSPMFQFADQAAAVATAQEVLRLLRQPAATAPSTPSAPSASPASAPPPQAEPPSAALPARRGFLLGRRASPAQP